MHKYARMRLIKARTMRYTIKSTKYIAKNFLYLIPFAFIPAFFCALSVDGEAIRCAIEAFFGGGLVEEWHFFHLFRAISVFNFASWEALIGGLLAIPVMIVCVAMLLALLDKHMRIGKRTYNGIFIKLNDNLLSTAGYIVLLLVVYEIWALLTSALLFFFSRVPIPFFAYFFVIVSFIGMHVVLIYVISFIYLWLPCMQITGFRAGEALYYSHQLMAPIKWKILFSQVGLLLATEGMVTLCAMFIEGWLFLAFTTLFCMLLLLLYCVRMMVVYFDRDNIDRADLRKYYQR